MSMVRAGAGANTSSIATSASSVSTCTSISAAAPSAGTWEILVNGVQYLQIACLMLSQVRRPATSSKGPS